MSLAPNDLFLAATTADGSVYATTRQASDGSWSTFNKVSSLTQARQKNIGVTVTADQQVCAINDSAIRQLRYSKDLTGTTPAVLVASGIAPASAESAGGSLRLAVLGLGPRTVLDQDWSFGLPLFLVKPDQTVVAAGDELRSFDPGDLKSSDRPVALDVSGTFNDTVKSYELVLVGTSGNLDYANKTGTGRTRFELFHGPASAGLQAVSVSCSSGFEGFHVCFATRAGGLSHFVRSRDGVWHRRGDVSAATGSHEMFTKVVTYHHDLSGGRDGILHVVAINQAGGLFYANRSAESTADPLWTTFLDVKSMAGDKGRVTSVDIAVQP